MPLCQLFINKTQDQFMLIPMPEEITPDKYQDWIVEKEGQKKLQAFTFTQQLLDRIALSYVSGDESAYQAKYVLMKAPDEEQLFVSSLEISSGDEEKLDIVRNGLLIVFDEQELQHFTPILQKAWNDELQQ